MQGAKPLPVQGRALAWFSTPEAFVEPRLKAGLLVQALVRRCGVELLPAYVARKGDAESGAVLIKRVSPGWRCTVFQTVFGENGERRWIAASGETPVAEAEADAFVARQTGFDCDLWVVEVEAPETWTPDAS
jgi:hypothetical protein